MNVEIIDQLIAQDPSLESSRSALEAMNEGASCIHKSWGLGKITGFEADRGMLLIDFEDGERKSHAMDPVFCLSKIEVLDNYIIAYPNKSVSAKKLSKTLSEQGVVITHFAQKKKSLEEQFLSLTKSQQL